MKRGPALAAAALIVVSALLFIRVCADGAAMGGARKSCECRGYEWQLYDRRAADGPQRTMCIGWVHSTTCYQAASGLVVPCKGAFR